MGVYSEEPIKAYADGRELTVERQGSLNVIICEKDRKRVVIK